MDNIRLSSPIQTDSVVDGDGLRCVLWTQGCNHACPGCHNPNTHDRNGGFLEDINAICKQISDLVYHDGLTVSGGEPFLQPKPLIPILKYTKSQGMNVWVYTGYTIEELLEMKNNDITTLFEYIDVLVDGKFIQNQFSYSLKHRGSSNQRIIQVSEYLEKRK